MEMLYSTVLKLSDEDAERVKAYCLEHNLRTSVFRTENKTLPNCIYVWGTRRELKKFSEYF